MQNPRFPVRRQSIWSNYQIPCDQYFPAYIVFCESWKDLHRHVIFLCPYHGLASAFLYGAASKRNPLRATLQAFSFGRLNVGKKKRYGLHITDWHLEAPNLLVQPPSCMEVYQHAALWSELLLYSYGLGQQSGEPAQLFAELRSLLSSVLYFSSATHCLLATLRFFWQFLLLEGFQPDMSQCQFCNQDLCLLGQKVFFSARSELLCPGCAQSRSGRFLGMEELNLLCWAEQDLASFVRQEEFFFGNQASYYSQLALRILVGLQGKLEQLLGRPLRSVPHFA